MNEVDFFVGSGMLSVMKTSISYVITVYNKAPHLPDMVASLVQQQGDFDKEYVFVDDASTDDSLAVLKRITGGLPRVTIIANSENRGPSVRLNQGARTAQGEVLQFMDADDVMAADASAVMLGYLEQASADVIYGSWRKTDAASSALLGKAMGAHPAPTISDAPLDLVLNNRVVRMCQMVRRSTYHQSGGADERIFIQDESLPLRLALASRRLMLLAAPVIWVPAQAGGLSRNTAQLNHDRFLAYANMLADHPELSAENRRLLARCAISAGWKYVRAQHGAAALFLHPAGRAYVRSRLSIAADERAIGDLGAMFAAAPAIRRMPGVHEGAHAA